MMIALVLATLFAVTPADGFDPYLAPELADGFSNSSRRAASPARGRVIAVTPDSVLIEHAYLENDRIERIRTRLAGLSRVAVKEGDWVKRDQPIGEARALDVVLAPGLELNRKPSQAERQFMRRFLKTHDRILVPREEDLLVLIAKSSHRLRLYRRGELMEEVEVGFGQQLGAKEKRGDNRTPSGTYFIVQKARGEFPGLEGVFYGGHWLRLNYPNPWDAQRGVARGWISKAEAARIASAWNARRATHEKSRLGGGIGFHGWAGDWLLQETAGRMSWGCIVFHNEDITRLFDSLPEKTPVILF